MILRQMLVTPLKEEKKQSKAKQYLVKLESYFPREKNGLGTRLCTAYQFNLKSLFILDQVALHSVQFPLIVYFFSLRLRVKVDFNPLTPRSNLSFSLLSVIQFL